MFEKLEAIEKKYEELTEKISNPEIIANQNDWRQFMKEHAELEPIVEKYREYKKTKQRMEEAGEMLSDPELKEFAPDEKPSLIICHGVSEILRPRKKLKFCYFQKIKMMIKTLSVKLEVEQVEMKQLCLQELYLECIQCMQKENIGNLKS